MFDDDPAVVHFLVMHCDFDDTLSMMKTFEYYYYLYSGKQRDNTQHCPIVPKLGNNYVR